MKMQIKHYFPVCLEGKNSFQNPMMALADWKINDKVLKMINFTSMVWVGPVEKSEQSCCWPQHSI